MSCTDCNYMFDKCDQITKLKHKVICDYKELMTAIRKGHRPDYSRILNEVSLVGIAEAGSLKKCDFYINYYLGSKWQITKRF